MKELWKKLINLLGVRTIITLALTATLIYGFVVDKIGAKEFLEYVTMVFIFFFAKSGQESAKEEAKQQMTSMIKTNEKGELG